MHWPLASLLYHAIKCPVTTLTKGKKISALILAAGYSSRMGHFKPLSTLGTTTAVERCVGLFRSAGLDDIRVVVGHRHAELNELLVIRGIRSVLNAQFDKGMFSSVKSGLSSFGEIPEAFFILPVDIPLVRTSSVLDMLENLDRHHHDIIYPCFHGKRGHPPLIRGAMIPEILEYEGDEGLRGYLGGKTALNLELPDEHILRDMDFPDQYLNILQKLEHYDVPSREECVAFLRHTVKTNELFIGTAELCADIAAKILGIIPKRNPQLRAELITAMALLYGLFSAREGFRISVSDISARYGDSRLTQFLGEINDKPHFSGQLTGESDIVEFAHLIATRNKSAMMEAVAGNYLTDADLLELTTTNS